MWVAWVEESSKVMITRFQDPMQVLWLLGLIGSLKMTNFETPNKYFVTGKARCVYIRTLTINILNTNLWRVAIKCNNPFQILNWFTENIFFWDCNNTSGGSNVKDSCFWQSIFSSLQLLLYNWNSLFFSHSRSNHC